MKVCRCGCGESVKGNRVFVDKEHQLKWMYNGGAREMSALQPLEAKARRGKTAGHEAAISGRLIEAARQGAQASRDTAKAYRSRHHPYR